MKDSIILPNEVRETMFCESESDFHKMLLAQIKAVGDSPEEQEFLATAFRVTCKEYLALVCQGKMKPYSFPKEFVEREKEDFKSTLLEMNDLLVQAGVPIKEGDDGKIEIEYEALNEMLRKGDF